MRAKLKVLCGSRNSEEIEVTGARFFIGRGSDCHLRPKSSAVSRQHCVLLLSDTELTIHDLHSKNGTFLNGDRVVGHQIARAGDILRVGPLEFRVLIQRDAPSLAIASDTAYALLDHPAPPAEEEDTRDAALDGSDEQQAVPPAAQNGESTGAERAVPEKKAPPS